jgi:hypothetical protein
VIPILAATGGEIRCRAAPLYQPSSPVCSLRRIVPSGNVGAGVVGAAGGVVEPDAGVVPGLEGLVVPGLDGFVEAGGDDAFPPGLPEAGGLSIDVQLLPPCDGGDAGVEDGGAAGFDDAGAVVPWFEDAPDPEPEAGGVVGVDAGGVVELDGGVEPGVDGVVDAVEAPTVPVVGGAATPAAARASRYEELLFVLVVLVGVDVAFAVAGAALAVGLALIVGETFTDCWMLIVGLRIRRAFIIWSRRGTWTWACALAWSLGLAFAWRFALGRPACCRMSAGCARSCRSDAADRRTRPSRSSSVVM